MRLNTAKVTNVIVTGFGESCNLVKESKMFIKKPRFQAEWEVSSEEWCIMASWFLSPMNKNSVLKELIVRRLAVTQEEMC